MKQKMNNKRVIATGVLAVLILAASVFVFVKGMETKQNNTSVVSDISKALEEFYYSKDVSGKMNEDALEIFETDIASYMIDKVDIQQHLTELHYTQKENYTTEVVLMERTDDADSNISTLQFQVISTFNYVGCDFDTTSSEIVEVRYDNEKNKVVDLNMHTPESSS